MKHYKLVASCFMTVSGKYKYINYDLKEKLRSDGFNTKVPTFEVKKK